MAKSKIKQIIQEILDPMALGEDMPKHILNAPVSYKQLEDFARLIEVDKSEESFQKYLSKNPNYLFRLAPSTDVNHLGFLAKPPINNFNTADYAILSISQGGTRVFLIEIERPSDKLFTAKLSPAKKLQTAIGQIQDWDQWIRNNRQAFINTCFKLLEKSPHYPDAGPKGSFIYQDAKHLESSWNGFGGTEHCFFEYLIVIGRWSQLTKAERNKLMYLNHLNHHLNLRIRTYDNLARLAYIGPMNRW